MQDISVSVDENGASRFDDHAAHVNPEPNKVYMHDSHNPFFFK